MKRLIASIILVLIMGTTAMADPPAESNQILLWASGDYSDGDCVQQHCAYMLWEYNDVNLRLSRIIINNEFPHDIALEINYTNGEVFVGAWATGYHEVVIPGNIDTFLVITPTADVPEYSYVGVQGISILSPCNDCSEKTGNVFKLTPNER